MPFWRGALVASLLVPLLCLVGCVPAGKAELDAGYKALEQQQYDQAMQHADAFLKQTPEGPGSPEALYLMGRAYEQKPVGNRAEAQANLQNARLLYIQALQSSPPADLQGHIHAGLGNVAFHQDDFPIAIEQWSHAYERVAEPDLRARMLYRIGLSQQRLGRFADADRTFAAVQREYAGTPAAQWSAGAQGARGFQVQLATFRTEANATAAVADLRKMGLQPTLVRDPQGRQVLRLGPVNTYSQARDLQAKLMPQYPDAMILP